MVPESVPKHQRDTLIAGRVPGLPDLGEWVEVPAVPIMTESGTLSQSPKYTARQRGVLREPGDCCSPQRASGVACNVPPRGFPLADASGGQVRGRVNAAERNIARRWG
jgi:hypothetical protein